MQHTEALQSAVLSLPFSRHALQTTAQHSEQIRPLRNFTPHWRHSSTCENEALTHLCASLVRISGRTDAGGGVVLAGTINDDGGARREDDEADEAQDAGTAAAAILAAIATLVLVDIDLDL